MIPHGGLTKTRNQISLYYQKLYEYYGPQHWWPAVGSHQIGSGGRCGEAETGSSHAPRTPTLAPAKPDARSLPGAAASQASGSAGDWPGRGGIGSEASRPPHLKKPGGIGGATAPDGPTDSKASPFEVIVGAILTQNTAWQNVERAILNLKKARLLSPEALCRVPTRRLAVLIRPSGYFNIKAARLKSFIRFLFGEYGGDIEEMLREDPLLLRRRLLNINGIGPETADSILLYAGRIPVFVIDTYTRRVVHRHGLADGQMDYHQLQARFMDVLPRDIKIYNEFHALIVRVGKEHCGRQPNCEGCPLELFLEGDPHIL
jgi:endonuclease III related protein